MQFGAPHFGGSRHHLIAKDDPCPPLSRDKVAGNTYQQSVTGLPPWVAIDIDDVSFDGCRLSNGNLIEAKGFSIEKHLMPDGSWKSYFKGWKTTERQLQRQSDAAGTIGRQVEWHIAEPRFYEKVRDYVRAQQDKGKLKNIIVVYNPRGEYAA